ncbi:peptide deformylase, mitochondrial-like [Lutzomyia longipalpis]|uniref:peptide deformylase, mitochondrial-like n=1 Tax=Lutzomyia longipalpis TaxID=7200 RepID=UPI0024836614|nr:peptide deformylase, mitochondrial-like [Lutzomyia longipalpis]
MRSILLRFNRLSGVRNITSQLCLQNPFREKIRGIHTCSGKCKSLRDYLPTFWVPKTVEPPYRHVTQIGDPILRLRAEAVPDGEAASPAMKFLFERMIAAMRAFKLVGLAAPQVGIPLRVIVMEFPEAVMETYAPEIIKTRNMQLLPLTILVNPVLKVTDFTRKTFPEGCGSMTGFTADVARYAGVEVKGYDENGMQKTVRLEGWNARIAQHETDHLEGTIFIDVMDRKTLQLNCWEMINAREGRVELKYYSK